MTPEPPIATPADFPPEDGDPPVAASAAGFYLRYLLDACAGLGLDLSDALPTLGVTAEGLAAPTARVPLQTIDRLLVLAMQRHAGRAPRDATDQDLPLSLQLGGAVTPVALDVLAYASMSSQTLGEAIALLQAFEPYRLGFGRCEISEQDGMAAIVLSTQGHWASLSLQTETCLAGWVEFGRWIMAGTADPVAVEFMHAASAPVAAYERFFRCPVYFERTRNAVLIDSALLKSPLPTANPQVSRLMRDELQRRTEQFAKGELFVSRLEAAIETCLPHGAPTLERLAAAMQLSPRQLRVRTRQAGITVPAAIDQVRRRLAERYLGVALPLADISQRLGYSEQSAFTRACVRWFGVSPGKWKAGDAAR